MEDWVKALPAIVALLVGLRLLLVVVVAAFGLLGFATVAGPMAGFGVPLGVALFAVLVVLVPLALLLLLGVLAVAVLGRSRGPSRDAALEELREAYARGDLTTDEFEERRARLEDQ